MLACIIALGVLTRNLVPTMCTPVINKLTKIHASRPCIALGRIECPIEHSIGARFSVRHVSNNPSEHKSCRLRAPRRLQLVAQLSQRRSPVSSKAASADSLVVTSTGTQLPRTPLAMVEQVPLPSFSPGQQGSQCAQCAHLNVEFHDNEKRNCHVFRSVMLSDARLSSPTQHPPPVRRT